MWWGRMARGADDGESPRGGKTRGGVAGAAAARMLALHDLFAYRFGLGEQIQVVRAAGFGIGSRHVEAAEGMRTDHGARTFAVDVQVANLEFADGAIDLVARAGVNGSGQAELGVIPDFQRVVE